MFWNKTLLKWEEPRFAQKYFTKQLRLKDYLSAFGKVAIKLTIGTYIIVLFLRWVSPRPLISFFDFEILSIVLFVVGSFFVIWIIMLAGSRISKPQVVLREKDIIVLAVEGQAYIPYKKMESFSIINSTLDGNEFFVLNIKDWDGNESFIEIDPKIKKEAVVEVLKSKNVQMKASLLSP